MNNIIKESEKFFRDNLPESRKSEVYIKHIELVRKYALILAEEYNADFLIVEIAALLHDVGADAGFIHAEKSAKMVKEFLSNKNMNSNVKERILAAIERHSSKKKDGKFEEEVTLEDQVVRDADAISFLEDTFKGYFEKKLKIMKKEEAREVSLKKIKAMLNKITTKKGKEFAEKFYKKAKNYLKNI